MRYFFLAILILTSTFSNAQVYGLVSTSYWGKNTAYIDSSTSKVLLSFLHVNEIVNYSGYIHFESTFEQDYPLLLNKFKTIFSPKCELKNDLPLIKMERISSYDSIWTKSTLINYSEEDGIKYIASIIIHFKEELIPHGGIIPLIYSVEVSEDNSIINYYGEDEIIKMIKEREESFEKSPPPPPPR